MPDQNDPQDKNATASDPRHSRPLEPLVAPVAPDNSHAPTTTIPPGAHPLDPSIPFGADAKERGDIPLDAAGDLFARGTKPWSTENPKAFPVYQRSASDWNAGVVVANLGTNGGVATVVGRQKGRLSVTLWVPATLEDGSVPLGVIFGPNESELQNPANRAAVLNVNDAVTIYTEGSVYVGVIGSNLTGTCQYLVLSNPLGGALGGD